MNLRGSICKSLVLACVFVFASGCAVWGDSGSGNIVVDAAADSDSTPSAIARGESGAVDSQLDSRNFVDAQAVETLLEAASDFGPETTLYADTPLPVEAGAMLGNGETLGNTDSYAMAADSAGNVFIAGLTSDWSRLGISGVDAGTPSVGFVAKIGPSGAILWATGLPLYQFPHFIALDGEQAIVVVADTGSADSLPYGGYGSSSFLVTRFDEQGAIANTQTFSYRGDNPDPTEMVVDQAGEIQIAVTIQQAEAGMNNILELLRLQPDFSVDTDTRYPHTGDNANAMSMSVAANGDLLVSGYFDNQLNFGGTPLQSTNLGPYYAIIGFAARLKPDHTYVSAMQFGDLQFADGTAIVEQAGSVYLGGVVYETTSVGGVSITGDANGTGFVAKMSTFGSADWVFTHTGESFLSGLVAGQDRVIALTTFPSAPYLVQDVTTIMPQTILTLAPSQQTSAILAAGGSSFWLSVGVAGTLTITPPGTIFTDAAGTLLLQLPQ